MYKIGFIGAGNIATALIYGAVTGGCAKKDICVFDVSEEKVNRFASEGFSKVGSGREIAEKCEIVFLTVKPAHLCEVLDEIKPAVTEKTVLVSVIAGVSIRFITERLGKNVGVVRVMPNTPALIGYGATAISYGEGVDEEMRKTVKTLFDGIGTTEVIDESKMCEIISVNGSSPAYVYMFIKALTEGGIEQGIDESVAKRLAIQAVIGSARLAAASDKTLDELITQVCSPNGTTLKAVESLEKDGFCDAVKRCMTACTKRAKELEGEL